MFSVGVGVGSILLLRPQSLAHSIRAGTISVTTHTTAHLTPLPFLLPHQMSSTTTSYLVLFAVVALSAASDDKHDTMISAAVEKIKTDLNNNAPQLRDSPDLGATIADTLDTWMHELDVSVKTGHLRNFVGATSKHGLPAVHPETGLTHAYHGATKQLAEIIMKLRMEEAEQKGKSSRVQYFVAKPVYGCACLSPPCCGSDADCTSDHPDGSCPTCSTGGSYPAGTCTPDAEKIAALEERIQVADGDHDAPEYLGESTPGVHSFNLGGADVKSHGPSTSASANGRLLADDFPDTYGGEESVC